MEQNNNIIQNNSLIYILIGALQLIFCNQITGIITIIFSALADDAYKKGDVKEYLRKIKNARIASIIGVLITILFYVIIFLIYGAILLLNILES